MATEDKIMCGFCLLAFISIILIIGGCTYVNRNNDHERFVLEQQRLDMAAKGQPAKLEVVVHKLDDEQFKELIQAIKEKP